MFEKYIISQMSFNNFFLLAFKGNTIYKGEASMMYLIY